MVLVICSAKANVQFQAIPLMNKILVTVIGSLLGIFLLALLGGVGWLVIQVWDMRPKVTETAYRVDRIVEVLPEVGRHVAEEELRKRVQLAFIARDAFEI